MTARVATLDYSAVVVDADGNKLGTCFQVRPGVLVSAAHVVGDERGGTFTIRPLDGTDAFEAMVHQVDSECDLAVLRASGSMAASAPGFIATDSLLPGAAVGVTGFGVIQDSKEHQFASTSGVWDGLGSVDDVRLGEMIAPGLMSGMSGAAVMDAATGYVAGVVISRYKTAGNWMKNRVWVSRTEALKALLPDLVLGPARHDAPAPKWLTRVPERRGFVGREKSLAKLASIAESGRFKVAVRGLGGQGKTALAEEFIHRLRTRTDVRVLWPRTEPATPTLEQFVDDLLELLERPIARRLQLSEKSLLVADVVALEPTLVVFDNWEKFDTNKDFVRFLKSMASSASVLVATRRDPNTTMAVNEVGLVMQVVDLHEEDPEDQHFFDGMQALYETGAHANLAATDKAQLLRLTGGNALALQLLIAELALGASPPGLVRRLGAADGQLMSRIFRGIWRQLSRPEQGLLRALQQFATPPTGDLLASAANLEVHALDVGLRNLTGRSLVSVSMESGRITAHPLTLEFVRQKEARWGRRRSGAVKRYVGTMLEFCRQNGGEEWRWDQFDRLDAELLNIWRAVEIVQSQHHREEIVELRDLLTLFLSIRGHWDRRLSLSTAAVAAATDPETEARIHVYDLCYVHLKRGEIGAAEVEAVAALQLLTNRSDDSDLANVKRHLGRIAHESGRFDEAEALYLESRVLYMRGDIEYGAFLDWDLGDLAVDTDDLPGAKVYFRRAYEASDERPGKSQAVHAMAARSLGQLALDEGELVTAQVLLEEGHRIAFEVGRADEMALSSLQLSRLWKTAGETARAVQLAADAAALFRQLGDKTRLDQAELLMQGP